MVSLTTRVANIMRVVDSSGAANGAEMRNSLDGIAGQVENTTWALVTNEGALHSLTSASASNHGGLSNSDATSVSHHPKTYIVQALNSALVIFFYRRVYGLSRCLLQPYVHEVVTALKDFSLACEVYRIEASGSPWPAFMAGCEAMNGAVRHYLSSWMRRGFDQTGFDRFKTMLNCMEQVWKQQEALNPADNKGSTKGVPCWESYCRDQQLYVMLS